MKRIREIALITFMVLLPLTYAYPEGLRTGQEQFFQYALFCLLGLFIGNIWLGLFLILNIFLYIYNGEQVGTSQVLNIALGCILFMISKSYFKDKSFIKTFKWLYIVLFLNILMMSLQVIGIDPINTPQDATGNIAEGALRMPIGFMGIKMANSIFMAIMWVIMASSNILLSFIILIPMAICASSMGIMAMGCAALFYTFHLHRKIFLILLALVPISVTAYCYSDFKTDGLTFKSRFAMWHQVLSVSLKHPQGFGPDSFRNINKYKKFMIVGDRNYNPAFEVKMQDGNTYVQFYSPSNDSNAVKRLENEYIADAERSGKSEGLDGPRYHVSVWDSPHNEYLKMLFEYGVIGFLLIIGFTYDLIQRFRRADKSKDLIAITACIIVYYVSSTAHFPLELARLGYLFPIILGAFEARTDYA